MKLKNRAIMMTAGLSTALVLALAGCGNGGGTSNSNTANSTSSAIPQKGGTVVLALPPQTNLTWYFPISNSQNASLYNQQLINMMYNPLVYIDYKYNIDYANSIASNITYNSAGTVYTVTLNPNYKWSNGQPVTAQDVVFDYNLIKATDASNAPAPWPNYNAGSGGVPDNVKSVVATDDHTVIFTLKSPANQKWFIYNGIGQIWPLPEAAWNKYPNDINREIVYLGKKATDPTFFTVVDGAFQLTKAVSNQSWTMVPNPTFGGHKSLLDKLVFEYEGSNDAEFAALKTGAVNLGYLDLSQYGSKDALTSMGDQLVPGYNLSFFNIELNQLPGSPMYKVFTDLKVRQALQMGIDQDTINTDIYHGYAPPQYGPIPAVPATSYLDPRLTKPLYPFNIDQAKQLLESDGWSLQNGVMTKNGTQLKFTMIYSGGSESTTQMNELIKEDWAKMGVQVTLKSLPFATLEGIIGNAKQPGAWTAAGGQGVIYGGSYPSGETIFQPGGLDSYGYNDPTENTLIKKTTQPAASDAANTKAFNNFEYYTAQQEPVLWNNNFAGISVNAPNVHNATNEYLNPTVGYPLLQYLWVSSK